MAQVNEDKDEEPLEKGPRRAMEWKEGIAMYSSLNFNANIIHSFKWSVMNFMSASSNV